MRKISETMVGRNREREMFERQFDLVLEGGMGLTVVTGGAGIGKTFFVEHATGMFAGGSATYVRGKFRQYEGNPLLAFSEVVEQMVRHILTLPGESLKNIKHDLEQQLGADLGIILSFCPYAQILFGAHKAVNADSLERLKYRVRKAVYQFMSTVSTVLFPLIIFIDDLQWADTLSVNIVEYICQDHVNHGSLNLHLVLASRNDDSGKAHLNLAKLPDSEDILIELEALQLEDIDQFVRLAVEGYIEHKGYLVRILYGLTLGNPFNMGRILELLLDKGVLAYSPADGKWLMRHDRLEGISLPTDIEQLLTEQIEGLQKEDKELLHVIACCTDVTFPLLKLLTGREEALLKAQLNRLCQESLLVETTQDYQPQQAKVSYSFTHDIVLKLAYNNLAPADKAGIHYHIAETLTDLEDRTFSISDRLIIAGHLLRVAMPLLKESKTKQWIEELYQAGLAARHSTAVEQALVIFERCADLLHSHDQEGNDDFALNVRLELGECQFICEKVDEAKKTFAELLAKYPGSEDQLRIKRKYINNCACNGDFEKVMELGLEILAQLKFRLDSKHLLVDLIKSRALFSAERISRLKDAPTMTDQRILSILETLAVMAPAANRTSDSTSALIALKMAILSAKHGNSASSPIAYAGYCYVLFHVLKDHKKGKQLEDITLSLLEKSENAAVKAAAYCVLGTFVHHWTNPLWDTEELLEQSIVEGEKGGASLYGSYAIIFSIAAKYVAGRQLGEIREYIEHCRKKESRLEHYLTRNFYGLMSSHMHWLTRGTPLVDESLSGEAFHDKHKEMFADTIKRSGVMIRVQRMYLGGEIEKAWRLVDEMTPTMTLNKGFVFNVEFVFYSILVRVAMHQDLTGARKRHNKRMINKQLQGLEHCVRIYKGNHYARYLLAQAEYDALFGGGKAADRLYHEAMDFAGEQGNLPLEALANLLAARHHRDRRKLAEFYAAEAVSLYRKWGADYVSDIVAEHMGLACESECSPQDTFVQLAEDSDVEATDGVLLHLSKIEKLSEDEGYLYLLDLLIRQYDIKYCAVFFEKSDEIVLKYDQRKDNQAQVHQDLVNINHISGLPHKILRYVARTETEVIVDKGTPIGPINIFLKDPYLASKGNLSLACLPIRFSGVFIGLIYMEKTAEEGFNHNLLTLVKSLVPTLLARQTSIRVMSVPGILTSQNGPSLFTKRELEVLQLVAQGLPNSEISGQLHITLGTVKNHVRNIYAKLEADNRVKAVMRARELKLIE